MSKVNPDITRPKKTESCSSVSLHTYRVRKIMKIEMRHIMINININYTHALEIYIGI